MVCNVDDKLRAVTGSAGSVKNKNDDMNHQVRTFEEWLYEFLFLWDQLFKGEYFAQLDVFLDRRRSKAIVRNARTCGRNFRFRRVSLKYRCTPSFRHPRGVRSS